MMKSFQITNIGIMAELSFGVCSNYWKAAMDESADTGADESGPVFAEHDKNENSHRNFQSGS
jgi:hypothetical protein